MQSEQKKWNFARDCVKMIDSDKKEKCQNASWYCEEVKIIVPCLYKVTITTAKNVFKLDGAWISSCNSLSRHQTQHPLFQTHHHLRSSCRVHIHSRGSHRLVKIENNPPVVWKLWLFILVPANTTQFSSSEIFWTFGRQRAPQHISFCQWKQ